VWDAALGLARLAAMMHGDRTLVFVGTEPNPAHDPRSDVSREEHQKLVVVNAAGGGVASYDLTVESVREEGPVALPPGP
jgi:hypothetical protein